jgi:hypothetical protein
VEAFNAVTSKMDMPALFVKTGYAGWSDYTEGKRLKLRGFLSTRNSHAFPLFFQYPD